MILNDMLVVELTVDIVLSLENTFNFVVAFTRLEDLDCISRLPIVI